MLIFEKEGFLEIEGPQVEEIYSSHTTVSLESLASANLPIKAVLCRHCVENASTLHVAFYCRPLKRALIFGVAPSSGAPPMASLLQVLQSLGFQLEPVNLNLTPALRQVVLKDIPGLLTPAEALRHHAEKKTMLADLEAIVRSEPAESEVAKRAAHKLNSERHLDKQAALLRSALEAKLAENQSATNSLRDPVKQVEAMTAQLHQALALAAEERQQREHAETIRTALEDRLQKLEADLVVSETRTAAGLRKISHLEKAAKKLQARLDESLTARDEAQTQDAALATENQRLQGETERLCNELAALEESLAAAEKTALSAAQAAGKDLSLLKKELLACENTLRKTETALEESRHHHQQLAKEAEAGTRRRTELEAALADSKQTLLDFQAAGKATEPLGRIEQELATIKEKLQKEQKARKAAEKELHRVQSLLDAHDQTVKASASRENSARPAVDTSADERVSEESMEARLREAEKLLDLERREAKALSDALDIAVKKMTRLEAKLQESASQPAQQVSAAPTVPAVRSAVRKLLPHETRPAPTPGALFHPDWDLQGLPCRTPGQVLDAWQSVYNVQLALEGYATQYCMAFLVVLKEGSLKRVYLLFDLKKDQHLLVCVPGRVPRNEAELKELVKAAQKYLKLSGFELEKISAASLETSLKKYYSPLSS